MVITVGNGRCDDRAVSTLESISKGPVFRPCPGHCVMVLGKDLTHLQPGVYKMSGGECNAESNLCDELPFPPRRKINFATYPRL